MGNQVSSRWLSASFVLIGLCAYLGCTNNTKSNDEPEEENPPAKPTCQTNAVLPEAIQDLGDSSYQYVQMQVDFGPRIPETEAHRLCGDQLIEWLSALRHRNGSQVQDTLKAFLNFKQIA